MLMCIDTSQSAARHFEHLYCKTMGSFQWEHWGQVSLGMADIPVDIG